MGNGKEHTLNWEFCGEQGNRTGRRPGGEEGNTLETIATSLAIVLICVKLKTIKKSMSVYVSMSEKDFILSTNFF